MTVLRNAQIDPPGVRRVLIGIVIVFFGVLFILPLLTVFYEALSRGLSAYFSALSSKDSFSALGLTLTVILWVVPLNTVFGVLAAWLLTRFNFRGKTLIMSLIDIPFAVSPVIAGLIIIMSFGGGTPMGQFFRDLGFPIIFSTPGIIIATLFITFPFVVRELLPLMQNMGSEEEEAALTLGASGWKMFFHVTLPNIKWSLIYGVILCNARAIGEFGAVSVVSGHISQKTNTLPLHVEILFNDGSYDAAFSVSTLLVFIAFITVGFKAYLESRQSRSIKGVRS